MSQTQSTVPKGPNFWWGLGANVESQLAIGGVTTMIAKMNPIDGAAANCLIRVACKQIGPGLGGGGDVVLVIATGVASPAGFPAAKVDGGWNVSFRDIVSFTSTPESCYKLARMIKMVPMAEILDFTIAHPSYLMNMKDAVMDFYNTAIIGYDTATAHPKLWMFPVAGVGFEMGLTYQFGYTTEVVNL